MNRRLSLTEDELEKLARFVDLFIRIRALPKSLADKIAKARKLNR